MFRRNIHVEELEIIKIEKIGKFVLLFLEYVKPIFCGILNAAQPDPDSTSSGKLSLRPLLYINHGLPLLLCQVLYSVYHSLSDSYSTEPT